MENNSFKSFAPTILQSYKRNPDEFWEVSLSPFLNRSQILTFLKHSRVCIQMLKCFHDIHLDTKEYLSNINFGLNLDIWEWDSLKSKEEYFTDAYPIYAFLVVWLHENKLYEVIEKFDLILEAVINGIAGYGILDVIVDSTKLNSTELIVSQCLISKYENLILQVFGKNEVNYNILHYIRNYFLEAEVKEKLLRYKQSPYEWEKPIQCGYKAAHLLTPFMLSLSLINKRHLIDSYFEVFFKFGAVIQIIDDYKDLEEDLSFGHYAYMCTNPSIFNQIKDNKDIIQNVKLIKNNKQNNEEVYKICQNLIKDANDLLLNLNDEYLLKIVKITELRMIQYFEKELNISGK